MVKPVKLCLNLTCSQMTTIIWHPASSASHVAVVLGLSWAARLRCHAIGHAVTSPFWCQTITSSSNNFSTTTTTTEKLLKMHLPGKILRIFLSFWEAYFGMKPACVSLGITIIRNASFTPLFVMVVLFLFQKIPHPFEGSKYRQYCWLPFPRFNIIGSQSGNSALQALFFCLQKLGKIYFGPKKLPFKSHPLTIRTSRRTGQSEPAKQLASNLRLSPKYLFVLMEIHILPQHRWFTKGNKAMQSSRCFTKIKYSPCNSTQADEEQHKN